MLLSTLFPLLLSTSVLALKLKQLFPDIPPFQLCNSNVNNTYYIVGTQAVKNALPKNIAQIPVVGFNYTFAQDACEYFGLRLANLTEPQLDDIYGLCTNCNATGGWLDIFQGFEPPSSCFGFLGPSIVVSNSTLCGGSIQLKAICQVPDDIIQPYSTVTSTTLSTTSTSTSYSTTFETDTTIITNYEFVRVTSTITQGTYDVTCITSTKTIIHTVHKHPHHHHHHHHNHHNHHHHDFSSSSSDSGWFKKNIKLNKTPTQKSLQKAEAYIACTVSINNFFLVENTNIGNNATAENACNALGYAVANVTEPILDNLIAANFFLDCNANLAVAGFWYDYDPLGCLLVGTQGIAFVEDPYGPVYMQRCLNQKWALCRAGPPVLTTSTIQTNGFTTLSPFYTSTITLTSLSVIPTSATTTETVTATSTDTTVFFTNASLTTLTTTDSTSTKTHTKTKCSTTTVTGCQPN